MRISIEALIWGAVFALVAGLYFSLPASKCLGHGGVFEVITWSGADGTEPYRELVCGDGERYIVELED